MTMTMSKVPVADPTRSLRYPVKAEVGPLKPPPKSCHRGSRPKRLVRCTRKWYGRAVAGTTDLYSSSSSSNKAESVPLDVEAVVG